MKGVLILFALGCACLVIPIFWPAVPFFWLMSMVGLWRLVRLRQRGTIKATIVLKDELTGQLVKARSQLKKIDQQRQHQKERMQ